MDHPLPRILDLIKTITVHAEASNQIKIIICALDIVSMILFCCHSDYTSL